MIAPSHRRAGLEVANPIELVGPVVLVPLEIRGETAGLAQPLGLGQMVVGLPKFCLGAFALVNVDQQVVPADDVPVGIA
jgi:hypothetical protein